MDLATLRRIARQSATLQKNLASDRVTPSSTKKLPARPLECIMDIIEGTYLILTDEYEPEAEKIHIRCWDLTSTPSRVTAMITVDEAPARPAYHRFSRSLGKAEVYTFAFITGQK